MPTSKRSSGERGSVLPLCALVLVVIGGLCLAVGRIGGSAVDAARARTAADAAALAGAAGGEAAATDLASANGAELVRFRAIGPEVEVVARIGGTTARARAVRQGGPGSGHTSDAAGLVPELRAAVARAEELLGEPIPITSGWRSTAKQEELWRARRTNPYPVARPGTSAHEHGRAIDVPAAFAPRLASIAEGVGLCYPYPRTDPVHFELCPPNQTRP